MGFGRSRGCVTNSGAQQTVQEIFFDFNAITTLEIFALYLVSTLVPRFAEDKTLFLINGVGLSSNARYGVALSRLGAVPLAVSVHCPAKYLSLVLINHPGSYDFGLFDVYGILVFATVGLMSSASFIPATISASSWKQRSLASLLLQFFLMAVATTIYTSLDSVHVRYDDWQGSRRLL